MRPVPLAATVFAACLSCKAASAASAPVTPATYAFYGLVEEGSGGAKGPNPGDLVYITVTVNTSFPAFSQQNHVTHYFGGSGDNLPSPILAVTVNGQSADGIFDNITISNNAAGMSGLQIMTLSPMGSGFNITLSSTVTGVLKSDRIPKQVFPGNFQTRSFSVEVPPGVTYSGQIVE